MRTRVPLFALIICLIPMLSWAESFPVKAARYAQSKWGASGTQSGAYDAFRENALNNFCSGLGGCQGGKNNYDLFPRGGPTFKSPETLRDQVAYYARICQQMESRVSQCCVQDAGSAAGQSCQISGAATQAYARNVKRVAQKNTQQTINQGADETEGLSSDAALTGAGVAGACYGRSEFCATKCEEVRKQFTQKLGSCPNGACTEDMLEPLDKVVQSCRSLQGQADAVSSNVGDLMKTSQEAGGIGQQTESGGAPGSGSQQPGAGSGMGGMNPMSMLGPLMQALGGQKNQQQQQQPQMMPQQAMGTGLDQVDCNVNPNMPGCPASGLQNVYKPRGDSGMSAPGSDGGSFNIGSDDLSSQSVDGTMDTAQGTPQTVNAIPNGGGSMPGGGGGGAASLGGGGGGSGAATGSKTDILHGERSGGGYGSVAEGMNMQSGDSGGYSYGGGGSGSSGYEGMDLSQYLPGGRHDPGRRLAGFGGGGINSQILSRDVNIWNRISDRIRNRCNQGLLRDCSP